MAQHDNSYKKLFSHAAMVEDLLRGFVHEAWVNELDFSTLEKVNGSYVTDDLRSRVDDIVWRVQWGQDWLYVYLLLEFQSNNDPWMAVRIMTYLGLLYQDLISSSQLTDRKKLPPVLPVVLYNGDPAWTAATDIAELVEEVPGGLSRYQPRLRYLLLSEREYRDEDLKPLQNLAAALFRLENSRSPQQLLTVVCTLLEWLSGSEQDSLRRAFTVWFSRVLFPRSFKQTALPGLEDLTEVKNMLAERVQEWNRESLEKGMQKGMQKGEQKGIKKGAAQLLIRLLEKKFGTLPESYHLRLQQADEKQIIAWSERFLSARTLGDVFGH
jgi:predicted transposase/invertase (TIGR01784 family)